MNDPLQTIEARRILKLWEMEMEPYRACNICVHAHRNYVPSQSPPRTTEPRFCDHPEAVFARRLMTGLDNINAARSPGGFCGPDARYLDFPGLHK